METDSENKEVEKISYASAQEFIKTMNEKQKKKEQEIKNEILIHLGLIDKEKSDREYFPYWVNEKCKWDEEVGKYYIGKNVPLEVSDEEYQEILKYAEIELEEERKNAKQKKGGRWGNTIKIMAYIALFIGVLANIILMFTVENISGSIYGHDHKLAETAAALEQWEYFKNIIYIVISFPFLMGFANLVSAAEKY
jgi:hypothetical protein